MRTLVVDGRAVAERGVTSARVVPALDPLEHRHLGLGLALEPPSVQELTLERGEEALRHRVVVGIADRAHGRHDTGLPAALAERVACVLPGFNWSSQRSLRLHLTSKIFIAVQSDANASEGGARCGASSWFSPPAQDPVECFG